MQFDYSPTKLLLLAMCTIAGLSFLTSCTKSQEHDVGIVNEAKCTKGQPNFPWCSQRESLPTREVSRVISEDRRLGLRKAILRAFPDAKEGSPQQPSKATKVNTGLGTTSKQSRMPTCKTAGPAFLLQETAALTYSKVKRDCLVQSADGARSPRPTHLNFDAYGCGAPDWCPNNGQPLPFNASVALKDHQPLHCSGRPQSDLREVTSPKTCDSEALINWSRNGDVVAKFAFFSRAVDNPNYKNDLIVNSITHDQALVWLVQAALPSDISNPSNSSCANSAKGVRDVTCANFGYPEAQIELAAVILRPTKRSPGWDALANELIFFASANGQPDAADQVRNLIGRF